MNSLLLSPHCDDETLFTAFTCLRYKPLVVVVFGESLIQFQRGTGITSEQRKSETRAAMKVLGCEVEFLPFFDTDPGSFIHTAISTYKAERIFAPAMEDYGHPQHNLLALVADEAFGADRVTHYLTYTEAGKSVDGELVQCERGWPLLKLKALACYESQINEPSTQPHFLRTQYEYIQA